MITCQKGKRASMSVGADDLRLAQNAAGADWKIDTSAIARLYHTKYRVVVVVFFFTLSLR